MSIFFAALLALGMTTSGKDVCFGHCVGRGVHVERMELSIPDFINADQEIFLGGNFVAKNISGLELDSQRANLPCVPFPVRDLTGRKALLIVPRRSHERPLAWNILDVFRPEKLQILKPRIRTQFGRKPVLENGFKRGSLSGIGNCHPDNGYVFFEFDFGASDTQVASYLRLADPLGFRDGPLRSIGAALRLVSSVPRINGGGDSGAEREKTPYRLEKGIPSGLVSKLGLRFSSIGGPSLLDKIICLQAMVFGLFGTGVCLAKGASPIPKGREGLWIAGGAACGIITIASIFVMKAM